ncbi:dihydrolipoamide acetyltransferase family protein [Rhizobium binae]|uniref:dihydrolipoamide acetyltransferase family protein n=1 Tax=Rhizobium binae TaxID=1138190 RepID=UPI001FF074A7|nr:dihydrolipoamide acetyltransferase family protein [Rhizobium binae]
MPSLGADMEAGTLVEWFRQPGEVVHKGDVVALVETQKGAIEIEVFNEGTLVEHHIAAGQKVPVGTVIASIAEPGETFAERAPSPSPPTALPVDSSGGGLQSASSGIAHLVRPGEMSATQPTASPVAHRRAAELGLDLSQIAPGRGGVIGLAEVEGAAALQVRESPLLKPAHGGLDLAEMRKAIAAAMGRSHREIPHYWVSHAIDATRLMDWLEAENARRPVMERILYAAPLLKATALALREVPELNGHFQGDEFTASGEIHVGIATSLRGGGLVAPAIRDVDRLDLTSLMRKLADLVPRARAGRLRSSEMTDATITLSSLGEASADSVLPLIYPPQVAIVGCGSIRPRPWAVDDAVAVRQVLTVTVAGDHRVNNGRHAGRFLTQLERLLTSPEVL